ncbi:hypothetical protein AYO39_01445 [Actinobacteria bacterium SCGC AG-212-D09]|nr:hypothetical protein AYO39_01445 [Actinobacteria bacterium SCGC AG-212-D09]
MGTPTEFGYVAQISEVTENTRKGARWSMLPAAHAPGNPAENTLLAQTATELDRTGIRPREQVANGRFQLGPTTEAFPELDERQSRSRADTNSAAAGFHRRTPADHDVRANSRSAPPCPIDADTHRRRRTDDPRSNIRGVAGVSVPMLKATV